MSLPVRRAKFASALFALLAAGIGSAAEARPTAPPTPVLRYETWVRLDDAAKMLYGKEDIVWSNKTQDDISDMLFHLYWNAFKNEASAFFEEAAGEGFFRRADLPAEGEWGWIDVTDIRLADGPDLRPTMEYVTLDRPLHPRDQTVMRVRFPEAVKPGQDVRVHIEFRSKIPRTVARSGYYKSSYFIGQWFPKPGVYEEGKGWNAHAYHENSEFFSDFADFTVHITVPQAFMVGASGKEVDVQLDMAAKTATHTFRQSMIHDFAWTADPRYIKIERDFVAADEVTAREYQETASLLGLVTEEVKLPNVKMLLFIEPEHKNQIERHFRALRAAIKYYGLWYGPYPYETVTMIDPPFRTASGGMEYPTLFTAGTKVLATRDVLSPEGVIIHEFGHGYWYGIVANNEFEEAWLDEGINTCSTGRVLAKAYGPGAFDFGIGGIPLSTVFKMPKVLDYETDRAAAINTVEYDPVVTDSWRFYNSGSYGANVYMRASTCLNTLGRFVGEKTMARIMRTYATRYWFKHPTTSDFIAVAGEVSGKDLSWFFDQFFFGTLNFDYGIASCVSVERPKHLRGVFDVKGKMEEVTQAQIRSMEAGEPKGKRKPEYMTTVTLRRYGEAKLGGDARIQLVVEFEDGTRETRYWDGQDRWVRMEFIKPAKAVRAEVDPERIWLVDSNFANNSFVAEPARRNLMRFVARFFFVVQNILQLVSGVS